jgi:hypothetical protein
MALSHPLFSSSNQQTHSNARCSASLATVTQPLSPRQASSPSAAASYLEPPAPTAPPAVKPVTASVSPFSLFHSRGRSSSSGCLPRLFFSSLPPVRASSAPGFFSPWAPPTPPPPLLLVCAQAQLAGAFLRRKIHSGTGVTPVHR